MRISPPNVRRATTVAAAVTLIASGATAGSASAAGDGTACAPTTRTLSTADHALPQVMSPRGHVVTRKQPVGGSTGSWLYRPDGSSVRIAFKNGGSPYYVNDVSGRGTSVGTLNINLGGTSAGGDPWASRGGRARLLPTPTDGLPTYYAKSINRAGAIAGAASNYPLAAPGDTDYESGVVVWADRNSLPTVLTMPTGMVVATSSGWPLVHIGRYGTSAILTDQGGSNRYFAWWNTVTGAPSTKALPSSWIPTDLSGDLIVGRIANSSRGFVASPDRAMEITAAGDTVGSMSVASNGTWMANRSGGTAVGDAVLVGQGFQPPGTTQRFVYGADVAGTGSGQLAVRMVNTSDTVSVISCALGLPAATDVTVTAPLPWTP